MHLESLIQYYALNIQQGVILRGILFLMIQNTIGNMLAGLANIDGSAIIPCNFIYHMGFQILIKI